MWLSDDERGACFIFDCGRAPPLGAELMGTPQPISATILLSHTHGTHQAPPSSPPLFVPGNQSGLRFQKGEGILCAKSYRPMESLTPRRDPVSSGTSLREISEVRTRSAECDLAQYLNHPAMTLGYRIEADGTRCCYMCDTSPSPKALDDPPASNTQSPSGKRGPAPRAIHGRRGR